MSYWNKQMQSDCIIRSCTDAAHHFLSGTILCMQGNNFAQNSALEILFLLYKADNYLFSSDLSMVLRLQ
jgi:hypothetical protein